MRWGRSGVMPTIHTCRQAYESTSRGAYMTLDVAQAEGRDVCLRRRERRGDASIKASHCENLEQNQLSRRDAPYPVNLVARKTTRTLQRAWEEKHDGTLQSTQRPFTARRPRPTAPTTQMNEPARSVIHWKSGQDTDTRHAPNFRHSERGKGKGGQSTQSNNGKSRNKRKKTA